jgi:hypothetical protein
MYDLDDTDYPDAYREITHVRFRTFSTIGTYGTKITASTIILAEISLYGNIVHE